MVLARNNNTPVSFWLDLPLIALGDWIETNNEIEEESRRRRD